jgi:hypothetical protein
MRGSRKVVVLAVVIAAAAIAGCGDDDGDSGSGDSASEETPDLAKPLLAECGIEGFRSTEPERQIQDGRPTGWRLSYVAEVAKPGQTTAIYLTEESPELEARGVAGGEPIKVGEQDVSIKTITDPPVQHVAQWRTEQARYLAVSDGATPARLKALIACMP